MANDQSDEKAGTTNKLIDRNIIVMKIFFDI
jgi:hypothetical protein